MTLQDPSLSRELDTDVEVVDVDFLNNDDSNLGDYPVYKINFGNFETLDIKLRNIGSKVVVLKEVLITVHHIWRLEPFYYLGAALPPQAYYSIQLPVMETPYTVNKKISQVIESNKADRFCLILEPSKNNHVFHFSASLVYNANRTLSLGANFIFATRQSSCTFPASNMDKITRTDEVFMTSPDEKFKHWWPVARLKIFHNTLVKEEMTKIIGVKNIIIRSFEREEPVLSYEYLGWG